MIRVKLSIVVMVRDRWPMFAIAPLKLHVSFTFFPSHWTYQNMIRSVRKNFTLGYWTPLLASWVG